MDITMDWSTRLQHRQLTRLGLSRNSSWQSACSPTVSMSGTMSTPRGSLHPITKQPSSVSACASVA
jgi:hypothetical protein